MIPKTIEELEALPDELLTCRQVSGILKADPHKIHTQAMQDKTKLGFPVFIYGTRVKIPKMPFIEAVRGAK